MERFSLLWKIAFLWQVQTGWKDDKQNDFESLIDQSAALQYFELSNMIKVPEYRLKSLSLPEKLIVPIFPHRITGRLGTSGDHIVQPCC